jgi:hypothetical protein
MKTQTGAKWTRLLRNIAAPLLVCGLLASCAGLIGPRQIEVPLTKLQAGMDRRFPVNNRILELFDIQLSRPQLTIVPDSDRIALAMNASIAPPFIRQAWSGSMALSGRLFVDAARGAVFMGEPRVDHFTVDGADENRQRQFTRVANVLMDNVVRDIPVYTFRMEDLRYAGVQFVPTRITTTPSALLITVEPAK